MDGNGIQPVIPMGNGTGGFGNGFEWILGLVALGMLGNGGLGFGNNAANTTTDALLAATLASNNNGFANAIGYENLATSREVQNGFDNQNAMANQREILSAVTSGTAQAVAATNATFHDTLAVLNDKYSELQRDVASLAVGQANALAHQNQCCCDVKMLLQQNNYDAAMRDAATNANFTEQIQGVKDMIAQNKIEGLQAQVQQLQLAQATAGMLKFPNSWTYGAGPFPPIFGGCCGNNNI